jgi:hypothetical protein
MTKACHRLRLSSHLFRSPLEELLDPPDLGSTTAADRDVFLEN